MVVPIVLPVSKVRFASSVLFAVSLVASACTPSARRPGQDGLELGSSPGVPSDGGASTGVAAGDGGTVGLVGYLRKTERTSDGGVTEGAASAPMLCGCSLCAPVVSNDDCSEDKDCAPSALCHATACVARAKAPSKSADILCTKSMVCHSVDANDCLCRAGKCALVPRGRPN